MDARPVNKLLWFIYYWVPVILLCGFMFFSSSIKGEDIPCLFPYEDILYHFSVYGILALFYIRALKNTGGRRTVLRLFLYTVVFCVLFGVSDELHQLLTSGRSCSIFDLITDTAGSALGAAVGGVYIKWRS